MTGRLLMCSGGLIVAVAVVGLGAYFAVAGFHLKDTVGVIGTGVGISGLGLAVYGMAAGRRGATGGEQPTPGKAAAKADAGALKTSAEVSGWNNVVNQASRDQFISQPITIVGGPGAVPESPPPRGGCRPVVRRHQAFA
ncbi:hypothetical protein [Actinomadura sp. 9N215]|uniref:hypothetical protein n=1 Tax=Actinomadura sp. 9N215 TaxID=3375150 RepID=UPI0037974A9F